MENTAGFYRLLDGELYHAPNFVSAPTFELDINKEEDKLIEIDGWKYFESLEAAKIHNSID